MQDDRLNAAFDAWLQAQTAALDVVRQATGVPESEVDLAEGYRWVTRLSRLALDWIVEGSDPLHPQLFTLQDEYKKLLVDNPDIHYLFCVLDDTRTYRLLGFRGECAYLGMTFGTAFGQGPVGGRTGTQTQTHIDEFELGPNGEVDILIAPADKMPDPRPRNAVVLEPGTAQLAIRETHFDKRREKLARLRMELVPEPGEVVPPPLLSAEELAPKLEFAAMFLTFVGKTALQMWRDAARNMNTFGGQAGSAHVAAQEDEVRTHTNAEMTYHGGRFELDRGRGARGHGARAGQAVPLLGTDVDVAVDGELRLPLHHDELEQQDGQALGRRIVAPCHRAEGPGPGVENWLDTGGRLEGYMLVRWVLADGPPHPTAEVVKIADL